MIDPFVKNILLSKPFLENPFTPEGWDAFFIKVDEEGLAPAFYLGLHDCPFVPAILQGHAKTKYEDALLFKDFCRCKLSELQPALCNTGRIVITKGLALCENIYREPLARPMGDIDLYLPDGSLDEAGNILSKFGFKRYRTYQHVYFCGDLFIDIHEDLWNSRRIPARKRLLSDIPESFVPSESVPGFFIPSPELLALHSVYHCLKHNFSRKIWLLDLILQYKAGYFNSIAIDNKYPFVMVVLEYLSREGLINCPCRGNYILPDLNKFVLKKAVGTNNKNGFGEIVLAFSCSSISDTLLYLASSLFPPKAILEEMYGMHPYGMLIGHRIIEMAGYTVGALLCKQK
jgi:hypothetical protein